MGEPSMRAVVRDAYGGPEVLHIEQLPVPEPAPGHVRVRVRTAGVNALDWHAMRGEPYLVRLSAGLRRPRERQLGADLAGIVDAVGPGVTAFAPGDDVLGQSIRTFAEFADVTVGAITPKPATVSWHAAGAIGIAGLTALQGLRRAGFRPGCAVLVLGAGGGVGSIGVRMASALGAGSVVAATRAQQREFVDTLGADEVVTADTVPSLGERFDVVLDAAGNVDAPTLLGLVREGGAVAMAGLSPTAGNYLAPLTRPMTARFRRRGDRRLISYTATRTPEDVAELGRLLEGGLEVPIDSVHPLESIGDAIGVLERREARGKVVLEL